MVLIREVANSGGQIHSFHICNPENKYNFRLHCTGTLLLNMQWYVCHRYLEHKYNCARGHIRPMPWKVKNKGLM